MFRGLIHNTLLNKQRELTNVEGASNEAKPETRFKIELLHQHSLNHVKHWHCIYLQFCPHFKHQA